MNYFNAWNKSRVAKRLEVQIGSSQFACHMQSQALTTQNDQGRSRLRSLEEQLEKPDFLSHREC